MLSPIAPFDLPLFLAAFGVGSSLLLASLILRDFYRFRAARIFVLLLITAITHWLHPWLPDSIHSYSYIVQSAAPALFWIFCRFIFVDHSEPRQFLWPIAFYSFLAPLLFLLIGQPDILLFPLKGLAQWMEYFLILAGLWEVASNWRNDLLESRRRLRGGIIIGLTLAVGWGIVSFNFHIGGMASRFFAINCTIFILAWFLLKTRVEIWQNVLDLSPPIVAETNLQKPECPSLPADEAPYLEQLRQLMNQGFYRHENLSLAMLAQQLDLPEYRVRAIINKALAYSNFSEYINVLRIGEAANRLRQEPDTPITNIALDVGYRTMSSFNRAFRKIHNKSPSDYRESNVS